MAQPRFDRKRHSLSGKKDEKKGLMYTYTTVASLQIVIPTLILSSVHILSLSFFLSNSDIPPPTSYSPVFADCIHLIGQRGAKRLE